MSQIINVHTLPFSVHKAHSSLVDEFKYWSIVGKLSLGDHLVLIKKE